MQRINFENTTVTRQPYVTIDGTDYEVQEGTYSGGTDLDAYTFNTLQDNIENALANVGGNEIAISETEPTTETTKLWINSGEISQQASEITNSYSTSTGIGYSANYVNNMKYERMTPADFLTLSSGFSFGETNIFKYKNHYTGTVTIKKSSKFAGAGTQETIGTINSNLGAITNNINTFGVTGATADDVWSVPDNFAYIYITNTNTIYIKGKSTDAYVKFNIDVYMKYNDNGEYKDIYIKTFDTLPVGTEVDYDGETVPDGWSEVDAIKNLWNGTKYSANDTITLSETLQTGHLYMITCMGVSASYTVTLPFVYTGNNLIQIAYANVAGSTPEGFRYRLTVSGTTITIDSNSQNNIANTAIKRIDKIM